MSNCFFFLLLFLFVIPIFSQVDQEERVEISVDELSDDFYVIPAGENGLIVFGDTGDKDRKGDAKWKFYNYDTNFEKVGSKFVSIDKKFTRQGHYLDGNTLYILFGRPFKSTEYKMVRVDVEQFEVDGLNGAIPLRFDIVDFVVFDNYMYLHGNNLKEDIVGYANLDNRIIKTMEFDYKGETLIESVKVNEQDQVAEFVISNYHRKKSVVYIHTFANGKFIEEFTVDPLGSEKLASARISKISDSETIVAGTYGFKTRGNTGMYLSKLIDGEQDFITYYKFVDFENFFAYLPRRKQEKIEKKQERKEKQGKDVKVSYNLLTHDIIPRGDEYILVAEAFFPTYRYERRYETIFYRGAYRDYMREVKVFDGWQYTHGIVAGFDTEGNMLWDQTFVMNDYKTYRLNERIRVNVKGEVIEMVYGSENRIRSKIIKGNEVVDREKVTGIATGKRHDEVRRSWANNLEYWYDDYFVIWGQQKIKNTRSRGDKKRKVFYFNKLSVE